MTALLNRDGTNCTLACDRCGHLVANLVDTTNRWDLAWVQQRGHGWTGAALATGPHTCPRCSQVPWAARGAEQLPTHPRPAPARRSKRVTVTELPTATIVSIHGNMGIAVNAALYDLLLTDRAPRRHIIVDLVRAGALDSGALGVLVRAQAHAARHAFDLCLVGLSRPTHEALRLLCLDHVLPSFADRATALAWLRGQNCDRRIASRRVAPGEQAMEVA